MGFFGFLAVLLVGIIIGVLISNPNDIQQLENSGLNAGFNTHQSSIVNNTPSPPSSQSVLDTCASDVNSALQIAEAKLPSGTSVSIVNSTAFYYNTTVKSTINNVNSWIVVWNTGYSFSGSESCESYYPNLQTCSDLSSLSSELNSTKNNLTYGSVVGAGVAIKFQFPPEAQSNGFTEVFPALCDPSGLMPASHNYIVTKSSYN